MNNRDSKIIRFAFRQVTKWPNSWHWEPLTAPREHTSQGRCSLLQLCLGFAEPADACSIGSWCGLVVLSYVCLALVSHTYLLSLWLFISPVVLLGWSLSLESESSFVTMELSHDRAKPDPLIGKRGGGLNEAEHSGSIVSDQL